MSVVMPFGLTNAPLTFQAAMDDLFSKHLRKFVLVFFDDILIYSSSWKDHLTHLRQVFSLLLDHKFFAMLVKCVFAVDTVHYLGHVINRDGVSVDPDKIQVIQDWPIPNNISTLQGFLGLTGYYRKFVQHYATMAGPLTNLLKSNQFIWDTQATTAFNTLKQAMIHVPVLALPTFSHVFELTTDAYGTQLALFFHKMIIPLFF